MTIYVDEIREYQSGKWCHLWSDESDSELDAFALKIGLKTSWAHLSNGVSGRFYHYDLRLSKRIKAIKLGAIEKPLREYIKEKLLLKEDT